VSEDEEDEDEDEAADEEAVEVQAVEPELGAGGGGGGAAAASGSLLGQLRAAADHYQEGWESGLGASSSKGAEEMGDVMQMEAETEYEVLANKKRKAREKKCESHGDGLSPTHLPPFSFVTTQHGSGSSR